MKVLASFILGVLLAAAAGCAPFAPGPRDLAPQGLPLGYSLYEDWAVNASAPATDRWWAQLGGGELDALMRRALSGDFSVRQAWAQLKQARAVARQAGAGLTPSLSATGSAAHTRAWSQAKGEETFTLSEDFDLGLSASYELDLWGRVRAQAQAGGLDAAASRQDLEAAAASVAESVAAAWIDLLSTREQMRLVRSQIRTTQDVLRTQVLLFAASGATALSVLEQRESLAAVQAKLPGLATQERTLLNQLAVLTGQAPGTLGEVPGDTLPELPAAPPAGLPADLLAKRPDVRGAGLSLRAADWEIAAARADRLPALTLSGSGAYSGARLEDVFDAWVLKLASSLALPLLDGGQRAAEVDRVRAVAEERLAAYEQTVFTAVREVEDALATEKGQRDLLAALAVQLAAARSAEAEARRRYLGGADESVLSYLQARSTVQGLELTLIQEKAGLLKNRVALYVALGGDWTGALTPEGLADPDSTSSQRNAS